MPPRIRPLDQEESAVLMALESRYTDGNSFTFEEAELVRWLIGESYIVEPWRVFDDREVVASWEEQQAAEAGRRGDG